MISLSHPPTVPPPGKGSSPATAGEQEVKYRIGPGMYSIYLAAIHTENDYDEEARISLSYEQGDGSTTEIGITSGLVSKYMPLCISDTRVVEGPGWIIGYVNNLQATSFEFNIVYLKYSGARA